MAKSTPVRSKGTPAKSTPTTTASPSAAKPVSASKKRVRVVDHHDEEAAPDVAPATTKTTPTAKKAKGKSQDVRDSAVAKGEEVVEPSSSGPSKGKGALKKKEEQQGKGKGKGKKVEKVAEAEEEEIQLGDDDNEEEDEEEDEEIDFLAGFESGEDDGEDSSDEEVEADEAAAAAPVKLDQLPQVKGAPVQQKLEGKKENKEKKQHKTGTVYLGRIPKGFYEDEMRSYFSQFGEVTRLRLSRNKKTGASKHYAFIEFKYASVAQIVHETMDNYLLAGHILVCKVVPDDQIHPKLWVGANRKFRPVPRARTDAARRAQPKSEAKQDAIRQRLLKQEEKKRKQLAELGIEYDFEGYAGKKVVQEEPEAPPSKKAKVASAKAEVEAEEEAPARRRSTRKSGGGAAPPPSTTTTTTTSFATKKKAAPRKSK